LIFNPVGWVRGGGGAACCQFGRGCGGSGRVRRAGRAAAGRHGGWRGQGAGRPGRAGCTAPEGGPDGRRPEACDA